MDMGIGTARRGIGVEGADVAVVALDLAFAVVPVDFSPFAAVDGLDEHSKDGEGWIWAGSVGEEDDLDDEGEGCCGSCCCCNVDFDESWESWVVCDDDFDEGVGNG